MRHLRATKPRHRGAPGRARGDWGAVRLKRGRGRARDRAASRAGRGANRASRASLGRSRPTRGGRPALAGVRASAHWPDAGSARRRRPGSLAGSRGDRGAGSPVARAQLDQCERAQSSGDRDRQVRAPSRLVGAAWAPRVGRPDLQGAGEGRGGDERLRVAGGIAQRAVAAHRQPGDGPPAPRSDGPVRGVDPRHKLADVVGLPARPHGPVARVPVRVPAHRPAVGHDDDQRGTGGDRPRVAVPCPRAVVPVGSMQQVEHRIASAAVRPVARRQEDAHARGARQRRRAQRPLLQTRPEALAPDHRDGPGLGRRARHRRRRRPGSPAVTPATGRDRGGGQERERPPGACTLRTRALAIASMRQREHDSYRWSRVVQARHGTGGKPGLAGPKRQCRRPNRRQTREQRRKVAARVDATSSGR
jgi:hypothetical protein